VRRPRAAHEKGSAVREATSGSEEDEKEEVEWGAAKYGVRMSPAHPWYVGQGNDTCAGEVVYTIARGPGWRIHGGVEDTKFSTNKQHSLSRRFRNS